MKKSTNKQETQLNRINKNARVPGTKTKYMFIVYAVCYMEYEIEGCFMLCLAFKAKRWWSV